MHECAEELNDAKEKATEVIQWLGKVQKTYQHLHSKRITLTAFL
jgi:hypothetical protein